MLAGHRSSAVLTGKSFDPVGAILVHGRDHGRAELAGIDVKLKGGQAAAEMCIRDSVKAWRGTTHMFENLDPTRTAHLIVDLQNGFMEVGATVELPVARDIVPNVNEICKAVRAAGGTNIFIRYLIDEPTHVAWSTWFTDFANPQRAKAMNDTFSRGCHGFELWPTLDVKPEDLIVDKTRFGAFVPGSCLLYTSRCV